MLDLCAEALRPLSGESGRDGESGMDYKGGERGGEGLVEIERVGASGIKAWTLSGSF